MTQIEYSSSINRYNLIAEQFGNDSHFSHRPRCQPEANGSLGAWRTPTRYNWSPYRFIIKMTITRNRQPKTIEFSLSRSEWCLSSIEWITISFFFLATILNASSVRWMASLFRNGSSHTNGSVVVHCLPATPKNETKIGWTLLFVCLLAVVVACCSVYGKNLDSKRSFSPLPSPIDCLPFQHNDPPTNGSFKKKKLKTNI